MKSSLCVVWAVLPCMAAALLACGPDDVTDRDPTIAPGGELEFSSQNPSGPDRVRLVDFDAGPHVLSLVCPNLSVKLYEDGSLFQSQCCGATSMRVLLSGTQEYEVRVDRSHSPGCTGPLTFDRLPIGPADPMMDSPPGGDETPDAGTPDAADETCDDAPVAEAQLFRVESIHTNAPMPLSIMWGSILERNFDDGVSHLLVRVSEFQSECGGALFELELGYGQVNEASEYAWLSETAIQAAPASISEIGTFATVSELDFVLWTRTTERPDSDYRVPLENVRVAGWIIRVEDEMLLEGVLSGIMYEDRINELPEFRFGPNDSQWSLPALLEERLQNVFGPRPGWRFDATIRAVPVEAAASLDE